MLKTKSVATFKTMLHDSKLPKKFHLNDSLLNSPSFNYGTPPQLANVDLVKSNSLNSPDSKLSCEIGIEKFCHIFLKITFLIF